MEREKERERVNAPHSLKMLLKENWNCAWDHREREREREREEKQRETEKKKPEREREKKFGWLRVKVSLR